MKELIKTKTPKRVKVKISVKGMHTLFVECNASYIKEHCKGVCCRNSKGILSVVIAPREQLYINTVLKATTRNGLLQPSKNEKWCPFQKQNGLCTIHKKKPIGCAVSPFNLTNKNTVIIRYRNLCMNCHKEGTIPAYKVFRKSLEIMFGKKETKQICLRLDTGSQDFHARMFGDIWEDLRYNLELRKK